MGEGVVVHGDGSWWGRRQLYFLEIMTRVLGAAEAEGKLKVRYLESRIPSHPRGPDGVRRTYGLFFWCTADVNMLGCGPLWTQQQLVHRKRQYDEYGHYIRTFLFFSSPVYSLGEGCQAQPTCL